jgi:hypothetical protein
LIRRQIFETLGGFEETFTGANEDMVFNSKIFLEFPVYVSSQCWDWYRRHEDSYWGNLSKQGVLSAAVQAGRLKYLNWLEQYLLDKNIQNREVWRELQKALFFYRHPFLRNIVRHLLKGTQGFIKQLVYQRIPTQVRQLLQDYIRLIIFQASTKIIVQAQKNSHSTNDLVIFCIFTNGEAYVKLFIEYYRSRGFNNIVLLDNGSSDHTISIARKYCNVTILKTTFKNSVYKLVIKKYLVNYFAKKQAYLFLEIDELLDFSLNQKEDFLSQSNYI